MVSDVSTQNHKKPSLCGDDDETSNTSCRRPGFASDASSQRNSSPLPVDRRILKHLRHLVVPLALGQFLSCLIAVTGITSDFLVKFGVKLPLAQNLTHYFLLASVYGIFSWRRLLKASSDGTTPSYTGDKSELVNTRRSNLWTFLRHRGWHYAIAGTIDVHANWAMVSAYDYTNLTSIQLLDCLTIPTAMILSRMCLKTHYKWNHVLGVVICLAGAGAMVGADYLRARDANPKPTATVDSQINRVLFGDFLVIVGAIGYGASNVYQEYLVRAYGIVDYLGFFSLVATIWTAIYCGSLERGAITGLIAETAKGNRTNLGASIGCLVGYTSAMFLLCTVLPFALSRTNSVLVNLSLLTADVYALLIGIFLLGYTFHGLYIAAFVAIILGILLFTFRAPIFREFADPSKEEEDA